MHQNTCQVYVAEVYGTITNATFPLVFLHEYVCEREHLKVTEETKTKQSLTTTSLYGT